MDSRSRQLRMAVLIGLGLSSAAARAADERELRGTVEKVGAGSVILRAQSERVELDTSGLSADSLSGLVPGQSVIVRYRLQAVSVKSGSQPGKRPSQGEPGQVAPTQSVPDLPWAPGTIDDRGFFSS